MLIDGNLISLVIFDADGTLRRCTVPGQPCPNRLGEWELLPGAKERLATIQWSMENRSGIGYGIASNQAGISLGYMTVDMAHRLLEDMFEAAFGLPAVFGTIQMCPHSLDAGCRCRKPRPAMLERLIGRWGVKPEDTLMVGDMDSDRQAAEAAGCHFVDADEFFGRWRDD